MSVTEYSLDDIPAELVRYMLAFYAERGYL
jgi:hypothetical protein